MADVKFSGLPAASSAATTDEYAANQSGTSRKVTGAQVKAMALVGTATNDDAAAGSVGEHATATLGSGSATSLSTGTGKTVTSVSLTAGDWDVDGLVAFVTDTTTNVVLLGAGISTTNNTLGAETEFANRYNPAAGEVYGTVAIRLAAPTLRISIASTTTVYLIAQAVFSVSTITAYGRIRARRVR